MKRVDVDTEKQIIESYQNDNLSMNAVGEKFNISAATVLRILRSYNIEPRTKGGIYKLNDDEIIQLYRSGYSC